ncbi:ABC transporter substrate binding protein [Variovorax humicola]|uniref:ABC transporter substrate binding protein n=1 Tax=Variovorax humicola TaxID=1769758 RepID=A0ABU8WC79_9BURK
MIYRTASAIVIVLLTQHRRIYRARHEAGRSNPQGARPADVPFEQMTRFELIVNKMTAAALSITIPPSILLQATRTVD